MSFLETTNSIDFERWAREMDWRGQPVDALLRALDQAIKFGLAALAHELATQGADLFPDTDYFAKMARILAPGTSRRVTRQSPRGLTASYAWAAKHAHEYRGHWAAVANGELLAAKPKLADVKAAIADDSRRADVLLIWIPPAPDAVWQLPDGTVR